MECEGQNVASVFFDEKDIEGVAAQLYERHLPRTSRPRFWVQLRPENKNRWRREALRKLRTGAIVLRVY